MDEGDSQETINHLSVTAAERERLLHEFNDTADAYPDGELIHELFERQVARTPNASAILYEDQSLTYGALNRRANRLAHALLRCGAQPDDTVAVYAERGVEMVIGLLGVLKAGGACVLVDPNAPDDRQGFTIEDSSPVAIVTSTSGLERLAVQDRPLVISNGELPDADEIPVVPGLSPQNLAYVSYTCGTVFQLIGVLIEHRSVCNLIRSQIQELDLHVGSRVLQFSPPRFSSCFWEVIVPLCRGASICIPSQDMPLLGDELVNVVVRNRITHLTLPPTALQTISPSEALTSLDTIVMAGEPCTADLARGWAGGRRFVNTYGRVEATFCASCYSCNTESGSQPPIGHPIANAHLYVLDGNRKMCPIGSTGEIYIGGVGLARGYVNHSELTADRFVADPFSGVSGARLFRSGDLGRWRCDGNLEFVGRNAFQENTRDLFDSISEKYDEINRTLKYIGPQWVADSAKKLEHLDGLRVLDLACGAGLHVKILQAHLKDVKAVGVDLSSKMIDRAREGGRYEELHIHDLHFPMPFAADSEFDLVIALGFLEFLSDPETCLLEIRRTLKPGGSLWASFQRYEPERATSARGAYGGGEQQRNEYTANDVIAMMAKSGMHVKELEPVVGYYVQITDKIWSACPYIMVRAERKG